MFSQCGNLFRELDVLQKFSDLEDAWNTFCILAKNTYMMFLMSLYKKNTLLMDILCDFVWEMFGKLMEYTKFPTKYYIMYPLIMGGVDAQMPIECWY